MRLRFVVRHAGVDRPRLLRLPANAAAARTGGYETWMGTYRLDVPASDKLPTALLEMVVETKKN